MTAVGLGIFCAVMAVVRRRSGTPARSRRSCAGSASPRASSLAVLAYPLSVQFFGPQSYHGPAASSSATSGPTSAPSPRTRSRSIAGNSVTASRLAQNAAEENAFFGWGLVILFFGLVVWMRRSVAVVTLAGVALLFARDVARPAHPPQRRRHRRPGHLVAAAQRAGAQLGRADPLGAWRSRRSSASCWRWAASAPSDLMQAQPAARGPVRVAMITAVAMALVPLAPTPLRTAPMDAGARASSPRAPGGSTSTTTTPWSRCRCRTAPTRTRCAGARTPARTCGSPARTRCCRTRTRWTRPTARRCSRRRGGRPAG